MRTQTQRGRGRPLGSKNTHSTKGWVSHKVLTGGVRMSELFKDKSNALSGITREEFISLFYGIPMNKLNSMHESKVTFRWHCIQTVKHYLLKTGQLAIISKAMPRGTQLYNTDCKVRVLPNRAFIFFKATRIDDALDYRSRLDKIATGLEETGENAVKTCEHGIKQKPIQQILQNRRE